MLGLLDLLLTLSLLFGSDLITQLPWATMRPARWSLRPFGMITWHLLSNTARW